MLANLTQCSIDTSLSDIALLKLLFSLGVLLITAKFFGQLAKRFYLPVVAGELFAGILLGQSVLHYIAPPVSDFLFPISGVVPLALDVIKQVALVIVLFMTGLELDLFIIRKNMKQSLTIGFWGISIPLILGFTVTYYFPSLLGSGSSTSPIVFSALIGIALSITALPVIAKILFDLRLIQTKIGNIIMSAAVIDDLVGWILFSILVSMISATGGIGHILAEASIVIVYVIFVLTIGTYIFNKFFKLILKAFDLPDIVLGIFFSICFILAGTTTFLGVHSLIGAFTTGVMLGNCKIIDEATKKSFTSMVSNLFSPIAFATITLSVNFIANFNLLIVVVLLILAVGSKFISVLVAATYFNRYDMKDSLAIATAMTARGAIEILLATRALHYGIIDERIFVGIIFMALATSYLSSIGLRWYAGNSQTKPT